jgi:hypothetical protein
MPRLYKGIGVGTFLHSLHKTANLTQVGIPVHSPSLGYGLPAMIDHIGGNTVSPFISLTRSYGVAYNYAIDYSRMVPTAADPAFVVAIDVEYMVARRVGLAFMDPVAEIAKQVDDPLGVSTYHHDGEMDFILGVANPTAMSHARTKPVIQPPGNTTPFSPARLSPELQAIVRALRDAEILVHGGTIPGGPNGFVARVFSVP